MALIQFALNGKPQSVNVNPEMPLLWVLRDILGITGTKFGCGMALCGACTVHIHSAAFRSCSTIELVIGIPRSEFRVTDRSTGIACYAARASAKIEMGFSKARPHANLQSREKASKKFA